MSIILACENCSAAIRAVNLDNEGLHTEYKCKNCNFEHDLSSDFATTVYFEIQNLQDMQAYEETLNLMKGEL